MDDNEVLKNLEKFIKQGLADTLEQGMEKACIYVEGNARRNAPVDDGQLRQSITHDVEADGGNVTGYIGTNVEYAPYVHQGTGVYAKNGDGRTEVPWKFQSVDGTWHSTKGQKANPFMQKAIDESKGRINSFFEGLV